jgi:outer membrane protein TolC
VKKNSFKKVIVFKNFKIQIVQCICHSERSEESTSKVRVRSFSRRFFAPLRMTIPFLKNTFKTCFLLKIAALNFIATAPASAQSTTSRDSLLLKDFLKTVVLAHPQIWAANLENDIAEAELLNALGGFDPVLKTKYEFKTKEGGEKVNFLDADVELPLAILFGPRIMAGARRGTGLGINPENETKPGGEYNVGVSLPLFQGIFTDKRRAALDKARLRPQLATANQLFEKNALLRSASLKYWEWSETSAQLQIARDILKIAELRAEQITRRARVGEVPAIDSVEALQEVERRRGEMFRAQRLAEQAEIETAGFLWNEDGAFKTLAARPGALPPVQFLNTEQMDRDRRMALQFRPEIQRIEVARRSAQIDIDLADELQRPNVEAEAQALYSKLTPMAQDYKLGLNISQPLLFRSANAQREFAGIAMQRIDIQRQQIERIIEIEIDNAISAIERARERIISAEREIQLAQAMLQAETRRFDIGESTLLFVNLRERALAEARVREVTARADYARALMNYYWATGRIDAEMSF